MDLRPVTRQFLKEEGVYQTYTNIVRPPVKSSRRDVSASYNVDFSTLYTWNMAKQDVAQFVPQFTYYKVWDAAVRQPADVTRDRNTLGKKFDRQRQTIISEMSDQVSRIFKRRVNEARGITGDIQEKETAYSAADDMFDFDAVEKRGRSPVAKTTRRRSKSRSTSKTRKSSGAKSSGAKSSGAKVSPNKKPRSKSRSKSNSRSPVINVAKSPDKPFVAPNFDVFWD
jgi:hypothetical protein